MGIQLNATKAKEKNAAKQRVQPSVLGQPWRNVKKVEQARTAEDVWKYYLDDQFPNDHLNVAKFSSIRPVLVKLNWKAEIWHGNFIQPN